VSSWQRLLFALAVLCAVALLGPAGALANGPSAGDQQYIDPLGSGNHHHKSNGGSSTSTTTPSTSTATSPPPATVTPTTTTATTASSTAATTSATPSHGHDPSGKTLPFTGFDVWLAAGLGLSLLAGGAYLRRANSQA
jgi:cytoskeletal protein RodZ